MHVRIADAKADIVQAANYHCGYSSFRYCLYGCYLYWIKFFNFWFALYTQVPLLVSNFRLLFVVNLLRFTVTLITYRDITTRITTSVRTIEA